MINVLGHKASHRSRSNSSPCSWITVSVGTNVFLHIYVFLTVEALKEYRVICLPLRLCPWEFFSSWLDLDLLLSSDGSESSFSARIKTAIWFLKFQSTCGFLHNYKPAITKSVYMTVLDTQSKTIPKILHKCMTLTEVQAAASVWCCWFDDIIWQTWDCNLPTSFPGDVRSPQLHGKKNDHHQKTKYQACHQ